MTTVSITIVTRNRESELTRAINAVDKQTYRAHEIIVLDNASTDGTVKMLERYFPAVRVIQMHRNIGCQPGRNIAMANCSGDIIMNLDDDGELAPQALEKIVCIFEEHPEVGLVAVSVKVPERKANDYPNYNRDTKTHYTSFFIGAAHALRREVLHDAGYFPEYVRGHSEVDLGLRIVNSGWEMLYSPETIMYHDVSELERDTNLHAYYHILHQLETAARLQPALTAWAQIIWRIFLGMALSSRACVLSGYSRGVASFLISLPRILRERAPISIQASRKYQYLRDHKIADLSELPEFADVTFWDTVRWRLKRSLSGRMRERATN
jgi:GT2 family glycosyltransferase